MIRKLLWFLLLLPSLVGAVQYDTLRGTSQTFDTYISEADSVTNYGTSTTLSVDKTANGQKRALIAVDSTTVVGLTPGAQYISVKFKLWCESEVNSVIGLYESGKPQKEATTTWNYWDTDSNWSEFGANNTGTISAAAQNRGKWAHFHVVDSPETVIEWNSVDSLRSDDGSAYDSQYDSMDTVYYGYAFSIPPPDSACHARNFGFGVPTGAIIDSLGMAFQGGYHDNDPDWWNCLERSDPYLRWTTATAGGALTLKGDSAWIGAIEPFGDFLDWWYFDANNQNHFFTGIDALWDATWKPWEINSSLFGIRISPFYEIDSVGAPVDSICGTDTLAFDQLLAWVAYDADTALDRAATALSSVTVSESGRWYEWDIDTAIFKEWLAGTKDVFPFFLIAESGDGLTTFTSSEGDSTPMLIVSSAASVRVVDEDGDLPMTIVTNDTIVITATVHADDRAFTFSTGAHDIEFYQDDPTNDTIYWGETGLHSAEGIYVNNACYNIYIHDINLVYNAPADSTDYHVSHQNLNATAIFMGSEIHDVTIEDSYVLSAGYGGRCFYDISDYNITLRNIKWDQRSTAFWSRENLLNSMVVFNAMNNRNYAGYEYHHKIVGCTTLAANWTNYYVQGDSTKVWFDSCYFYVDGLNEEEASGMDGSCSQTYAMNFDDAAVSSFGAFNTKVTNCTFQAGDDHVGGEGIGMGAVGADTTEEGGIWIYNNTFNLHKGYDGEVSSGYGIQSRQWGNNVVFRKNHLTIAAGTDDADSAYGDFVTGFRILNLLSETHRYVIDSNHIRASFRDPTVASIPGSATRGAYGISVAAESIAWGTSADGIHIRYNRVEGGTSPYLLGDGYNVVTNKDLYVLGDTLSILTDSGTTDRYTIFAHRDNMTDNRFVDCYYDTVSGASLDSAVGYSGGSEGSVYFDRSVVVRVVDTNGTNVEDARVRITNRRNGVDGILLETDTTDANGLIPATTVSLKYEHWGTTTPNGVDTAYTFYIDAITNLGTTNDSLREAQTWYWYTDTATIIVSPVGGTGVSIATPVLVGTGVANAISLMAVPRDKAVAQDGRLYLFPGDGSYCNSCPREYYSLDSGVTWTNIQPSIDLGGSVDYHLAVYGQPGRGIHFSVADDVSAGYRYRFMDNPATSTGDMNDIRTLNATSGTRGTVAARGDTSWVAWRITSNLDTLCIVMSVDTMKTVTKYDKVLTGVAVNSRIGMFTDDFHLPVLFRFTYSAGVYKYPWHGVDSGFVGDVDSVVTTDVGADGDRGMTMAYADGRWHYFYGTTISGGSALIHCSDTGASWQRDTIATATYSNPLGFGPKAGVRNDTIFLAYGTDVHVAQSPDPDPIEYSLIIFDPVTDTWSAEPLVLTGSYVVAGAIQIPSKIPTEFDFVPYYFIYNGTGADSVMFGKIQLSGGPSNSPPVVAGILDSTITEGSSFGVLPLDNFVTDPDDADGALSWSFFDLDVARKIIDTIVFDSAVGIGWRATITILNADSNGVDTIVYRVEDPSSASDEDTVIYTITAVNDAPVAAGIPDQEITVGSAFATITLDNYVVDVDNTDAQMTWTYSGNSNLGVNITSRIATITNTVPTWTGNESIIFKATDPGALYDTDTATFTVNAVPLDWHKVKGLKRGHKP